MEGLNNSMKEFLNGRHYATIATFNQDDSIHITPVWYLFDSDMFYISTGSTARKAKNVLVRPRASVMVDSRRNQGDERWVSASGGTEIIWGDRAKDIHAKILNRYITREGLEDPGVGQVFMAAGEVVICLKPESWVSWELRDLDDRYFGGILGKSPRKWFLPVD